MPMSNMPAVPSSKMDLICSRLFIWGRSASSNGSGTAICLLGAWRSSPGILLIDVD
jgi:hypothetical protein